VSSDQAQDLLRARVSTPRPVLIEAEKAVEMLFMGRTGHSRAVYKQGRSFFQMRREKFLCGNRERERCVPQATGRPQVCVGQKNAVGWCVCWADTAPATVRVFRDRDSRNSSLVSWSSSSIALEEQKVDRKSRAT
jgi:hypothetical protein